MVEALKSAAHTNTAFWPLEATIILYGFCFQQADETLDFEEQILEAAKSIAAATSALVKSASVAQRELVAQGKVSYNCFRIIGV
jgi:pseudouridine-5'-phosphate glycosidase